MAKYVALLRGINVSGQKQIKMAALKAALESAGLDSVETYLQSGNVVFSSNQDQGRLPKLIEAAIKKAFGHDVAVIVKSADEMQRILLSNPFLAAPGLDTSRLHVTFLSIAPNPENLLSIPTDAGGLDNWAAIGDVIYLYTLGGYGRTKLNNNLFERKLKTIATTRNWKSTTALAKLTS